MANEVFIRKSSIKSFSFGGLRIRDYTGARGISSSVALITVPPKGAHPTAYSKRSDKFYFIIKGQVTFTVGAATHHLKKGDLCIVKRKQRFSYRNSTSTSSELLLIHTPRFRLADEVFVK